MELFKKDLDFEVAVVAEIGVNHEGNVDVASHLISLAAEAGADAVKFQSYNPDRFISSDDQDRLSRARSFCLTSSDQRRLADEALGLGIHYFSTAVTEDMVPFLQNLGGVVKVASGDLTFKPVIAALAKTRRPFIVSTGLGTVSEIDQCIDWILKYIPEADLREHLILMHCVSAYPTPISEANILSVPFLADRYGLHVGYSHHVLEVEPCLTAVALGASIVEVHFTDRRNGREFRDHALSFEPAQLADLVSSISKVRASLGTYDKSRQNCELPNLNLIRKGVVAAHNLDFGTILTADDLSYARPATEYSSEQIDELIGKVLTVNLSKGQLIPRTAISD